MNFLEKTCKDFAPKWVKNWQRMWSSSFCKNQYSGLSFLYEVSVFHRLQIDLKNFLEGNLVLRIFGLKEPETGLKSGFCGITKI